MLEAFAPTAPENVPAGHFVQIEAPVESLYVPGAQFWMSALLVACALGMKEPTGAGTWELLPRGQ